MKITFGRRACNYLSQWGRNALATENPVRKAILISPEQDLPDCISDQLSAAINTPHILKKCSYIKVEKPLDLPSQAHP